MSTEHYYRLVMACPDQVGIVAKVSQYIAQHNGWMTEANYYADSTTGWFFMRSEIKARSLTVDCEQFKRQFRPIANAFNMTWHVSASQVKPRVVILVSRASHCLADLLHRWHRDELACDIVAIISNHQKLANIAAWHALPYHYVAMEANDKRQGNEEIERLLETYQADVVVLARYMQMIPPHLCETYRYRMINIHHSFLPSFVGADPYQQAIDRGVKIIGATCHYVTNALDAGPIIEQDVVRVNHRYRREDMILLGRNVEQNVLARGLALHLADRVVVHHNKTIIFD